jgi:hypothetical protein
LLDPAAVAALGSGSVTNPGVLKHFVGLVSASRSLRLNRANRIRTVHGSLAIEGNTLSEEQITELLGGKMIKQQFFCKLTD